MWALCKGAEALRVRHDCHYASSKGRGPGASIYIDSRKHNNHFHGKQTWRTYKVLTYPAR
jgi:hypothetical protein